MEKNNLQPGLEYEFAYVVPDNKTVPDLFPDSIEFQQMPRVFATGFMVGFLEWVCIQAINPYLDWPRQQTVGTHINVSHEAATPPGMTVTARVRLEKIDGRRLIFSVEAHDDKDLIARGSHERFIIEAQKFSERVAMKSKV